MPASGDAWPSLLAAAVVASVGRSAASTASAQDIDPCFVWGQPMKLLSYIGGQDYGPFSHTWAQIPTYGYGWSGCYLRFWMGSGQMPC